VMQHAIINNRCMCRLGVPLVLSRCACVSAASPICWQDFFLDPSLDDGPVILLHQRIQRSKTCAANLNRDGDNMFHKYPVQGDGR
jgi:hypothetical protein